jgi:pimeloyl-ACP methyl ester carboxylesterase
MKHPCFLKHKQKINKIKNMGVPSYLKKINFIMMKNIIIVLLIILLIGCEDNYQGKTNDFFYLRNDGADMPVYVEGDVSSNKFVIFLHGGPGGTDIIYNRMLRHFSDEMERNFAMVYYEQRGGGISSGNYSSTRLTVDQHVKDLNVLIELLKYKYGQNIKIYLIGHSWGGALGTAYLLKYQEKISGWVEVDGAHEFINCRLQINKLREIALQQNNISKSQKFWQEVLDMIDTISIDNDGMVSDEAISKLNKYAYKAEEALVNDSVIKYDYTNVDPIKELGGLINYYFFSEYDPLTTRLNEFMTSSGIGMFDEVKKINYTNQLKNITIPSLFLWGKYDLVLPFELGQEAYNSIGSVYKDIYIFQNSGHSPMLYEPDLFTEKVLRFVYNH